MLIPKEGRTRSRKHLDWLKTLPCLICGSSPCDPAHVPKEQRGSMGMKVSDDQTVPLCRNCHSYQHNVGHKSFWGPNRDGVLEVANGLFVATGSDKMAIRIIDRFRDHRGKT